MVRTDILQQELALGIMKLQWVVKLDILHCMALGIQNLHWAVRTGILWSELAFCGQNWHFVVRTGTGHLEIA